MRSPTRLCSLLLLGLPLLPAQQQSSPFQFVPKDTMLVMSCAGPGSWHKMFAGTDASKLMAGPAMSKLSATLSAIVDQMTAGADNAPFDVKALRAGIENYSGQLVFAIDFDVADLAAAMENDATPAFTYVLVLTGDGHTDLAAFTQHAGELLQGSGGKVADLAAGGQHLRVLSHPGDPTQMTLPALIGGNVVMLGGTKLAKQAERFLDAGTPRFDGAGMQDSAFALHVETTAGVKALLDSMTAQGEAQNLPFDQGALVGQLGVGALQHLSMRIGVDGKHVVADGDVGLKATGRGLLDVYGQPSAMRPKLLDYVPADAASYSAMQFDLGALYRGFATVMDAIGPATGMSREDMEAQFEMNCKVKLKADLIDQLGSEMLLLGNPQAQLDAMDDAPEGPAQVMAWLAGTCIGLQLQDGKKFGTSIDTMLKALGMKAALKSEDHKGTAVNRLNLGFAVLDFAINDEMLLLAFGKDEASRASLCAVLDQYAAKKSGATAGAPAAAVTDRLAALPDGWCGVSVQSVASGMSTLLFLLEKVAEQGDVDPGMLQPFRETLKALPEEMRKLGLDRAVSATYVTKDGIRAHARW